MGVQEERAGSHSHNRYFFKKLLDFRMDATGKEYWSTIQASVDQYYPIIRK